MATVNESALASLDAAAGTETTYVMSVGDTFNGVLSSKQDEDWIRIDLEGGKTYQITLSGRGSAPGKAEDTILKLFDANGNHIATNDDIDTANGIYNSQLTYTPTAGGAYYISADSYTANPNKDNSGAYSLRVALAEYAPAPLEPAPRKPAPLEPTPEPMLLEPTPPEPMLLEPEPPVPGAGSDIAGARSTQNQGESTEESSPVVIEERPGSPDPSALGGDGSDTIYDGSGPDVIDGDGVGEGDDLWPG